MPDLQQLAVLAFALVPGFIASEAQSFVALRRRTPALETTLTAIAYSAVLYLATIPFRWGPEFDADFARVASGENIVSAITAPSLLARYTALIALAIALGVITGRSLAWGGLRMALAKLSGRNVIGSTWQEFFHDRPHLGLWIELKDGRRLIGEVTNASDTFDERVIVLKWPQWVDANGDTTLMNLGHLMIDSDECRLLGTIPEYNFVPRKAVVLAPPLPPD